jgi:hypothetical protein
MQRSGVVAAVAAALLAMMVWAEDRPAAGGAKQALAKPVAKGPEFSVKLSVENGHVGELHIACAPGATDGYDRRMDDLVPPPGFGGIGYTFLVPPDRKMNFYRDVRAPAEVTQWLFYGRVGKAPIELSWDAKSLPKALSFYAAKWDGKSKEVGETVDMRKVVKLTLAKTGYVRIWTAKAKSGG